MNTPENSNYSVLRSLLDSEDDTGSELKQVKLTVTNNRAGGIGFYVPFIEDDKLCGLKLIAVSTGATKVINIPFNIISGTRFTVYMFVYVTKNSTPPVFSAGFNNDTIYGKITLPTADVYRASLNSSFTDDELICTVT